MFAQFTREVRDLVKTAISLSYFMRGGLQYHDAYDLTPVERDIMNDFVSDRIEQELKSPHPNY